MSGRHTERPGGADEWLDRILGHGPIDIRTGLIVAHPDDEAIAMAGVFCRFTRLTLAHVTSGSSMTHPEGDRIVDEVAQLREAEMTAALLAAQARPEKRILYGLVDGAVLDAMPSLIDRLVNDLSGLDIVVTHPYEGGHIDHDATALAVQTACARLAATSGSAPDRLEFCSYHCRRGRVATGTFWPDPGCREAHVTLRGAAVQRRIAAFGCHRSQEKNLRYFSLFEERFRKAPFYDFLMPPPPLATLYGREGEIRFSHVAEGEAGRRRQSAPDPT